MRWTAHIDGGSRGNPGPAAAGVVLRDEAGKMVLAAGFYVGRTTNNQAEYQGLLHALKLLETAGVKQIEVVSDSELMVRQVNGQYKVRSPDLRPLYEEAMAGLGGFQWRMRHTLREGNTDADGLANDAMDARGNVIKIDSRGLLKSKATPAAAVAGTVVETPAPAPMPTVVAVPGRTHSVIGRIVVPPAPRQCPAGLKRGQTFEFGHATPEGCCLQLCAAVIPAVLAAQPVLQTTPPRIKCGKAGCGASIELTTGAALAEAGST